MRVLNTELLSNPYNWITVGAMVAISIVAFYVILSRCEACSTAIDGAA